MRTKIIIQKEWTVLKEYDFLITMSIGDLVESISGNEYMVVRQLLDLNQDTMLILVKE